MLNALVRSCVSYSTINVLEVTNVTKVAPGMDRVGRLWREKRRLVMVAGLSRDNSVCNHASD